MRALLVVLSACAYTGEFPCESHDMCKRGDELGFCERTGYCTFTDEACETQRRYSELAPADVAGTCLDGVVTGSFTIRSITYDDTFSPSVSERAPAASAISFAVELEDGTKPVVDYRESDGAFSFERIGDVRYQLTRTRDGSTTILQHTAPHLRLGPVEPNRIDRVPVTRSTMVAFQQTPSMIGTTIVASTGVWSNTSLGATASNTTLDWQTATTVGGAPGLLDAAKHDRLYFLMLAPPTLGAGYQSLRAYAAYSLTQIDGMTTTAAGVLTTAVEDKCVAVERMALADYTRLSSTLPTSRNGATTWSVAALPAREHGIAGGTTLAFGSQAPPTDGMPMMRLTNPLPGTTLVLTQGVTVEASLALPNLAAVGAPAGVSIFTAIDPIDASCSTTATLRATVGIPGKLVVAGTSVAADNTPVSLASAGTHVTIQWMDAANGPGHEYLLALHELGDDGAGGTTLTAIPNTLVKATEPRITLPKSLFQPDHTYVFALSNVLGAVNAANGDFVTIEYPLETASSWSSSFVVR